MMPHYPGNICTSYKTIDKNMKEIVLLKMPDDFSEEILPIKVEAYTH